MAIKKKKVAFLYPGQGAQMPGVGLDFYEQNSAAAAVVDTAQSVLDFDVKSLCFAKNDLLNRTEYTQPCLVTCCLAMTAAILDTGIAPNMTAGLSLGEYAAIATAGAMDIKTALLLVRRRGLLMQNATKLPAENRLPERFYSSPDDPHSLPAYADRAVRPSASACGCQGAQLPAYTRTQSLTADCIFLPTLAVQVILLSPLLLSSCQYTRLQCASPHHRLPNLFSFAAPAKAGAALHQKDLFLPGFIISEMCYCLRNSSNCGTTILSWGTFSGQKSGSSSAAVIGSGLGSWPAR